MTLRAARRGAARAMFFSLPWDLRTRIWAAARFLTARHALAAHLPARQARVAPMPAPHLRHMFIWCDFAEARFRMPGGKAMAVGRCLGTFGDYYQHYTVTRDLERVRVLITEKAGGGRCAALHLVTRVTDEDWVERRSVWVHVTEASRVVRDAWTGKPLPCGGSRG